MRRWPLARSSRWCIAWHRRSLAIKRARSAGIELYPNRENAIAAERAVLTIDLFKTISRSSRPRSGSLPARLLGSPAWARSISTRSLARFDPVAFPAEIVSLVETTARDLGLPLRRLPSGEPATTRR